ncbi:MAG: hypothetical protein ACE5GL_08940 [Calditrichia bacterium]
MIGKTILHFTPWDKRVRLLCLFCQKAKNTDMEIDSNLLSNGVNKTTVKPGEACLLPMAYQNIQE